MPTNFPLSLYIHIPWCVKKCPYCDFNSHTMKEALPEKKYIQQMIMDLETQLEWVQNRPIHSIFIGGGTPSLFSPEAYRSLLHELKKYLLISSDTEITLEANPGTTEADRFAGYFDAGINRLSIGVQSFQNEKLKILGRIHESDAAKNAVKQAKQAGFNRINIDLMFGLPNQTIDDALFDLQTAIDLQTSHLSWYQLTLEPNTYFHRFPPILPSDDARFEIQQAGQQFLANHQFSQYEISAYSQNDPCKHNVNYWQFGDYLGIGAGAHAKLTHLKSKEITRRYSVKNPKQYLSSTAEDISVLKQIESSELSLEFMMNALRLYQPIEKALFETRTGLSFSIIAEKIDYLVSEKLLSQNAEHFFVTKKGHLFLNEVLEVFL
jgi:putative oxygen-independent coproporphyrinogen III oxidase